LLDRADLPKAKLDKLWAELYEGMTTLAPSGVMFGGRHSFVRVMARHKIEEGLEYGGALKPYMKDYERMLERLKGSTKRHDTSVVKAISPFLEKLPTLEVPELISIKAHIKNEPEPEYQKWLDSRATEGLVR
jgi:hypothetical protein